MSRRRQKFPRYKVQSFSSQQCCWIDDRREAFDSLAEAQKYISLNSAGRQFRVLVIEENDRWVLGDR
jgi:hypothetical protein